MAENQIEKITLEQLETLNPDAHRELLPLLEEVGLDVVELERENDDRGRLSVLLTNGTVLHRGDETGMEWIEF